MKTKWIVDPAEDLPLAVIENTEDGLGVCEIGERTPENIRRANLLSVAPELLESLETALEIMGSWDEEGDPEWARQARQAIAKAKGK